MKLQDVRFAGERLIEGYGDHGFRLTDGRHEGSILILPDNIGPLDCREFTQLDEELLAPVFEAADKIEIMLLGTGKNHHFAHPALLKKFVEHNIALETMNSGAACRTYNILVSEDRRVAAAIIAIP